MTQQQQQQQPNSSSKEGGGGAAAAGTNLETLMAQSAAHVAQAMETIDKAEHTLVASLGTTSSIVRDVSLLLDDSLKKTRAEVRQQQDLVAKLEADVEALLRSISAVHGDLLRIASNLPPAPVSSERPVNLSRAKLAVEQGRVGAVRSALERARKLVAASDATDASDAGSNDARDAPSKRARVVGAGSASSSS